MRSAGRALGLNRLISRLIQPSTYEDKFQTALLESVQPGECVWDVGANTGLYSKKFSAIVGPQGKVCAFEPSPLNLQTLRAETNSLANLEILPIALGEKETTALFQQGEDSLGATSRIVVDGSGSNPNSVTVSVSTGDILISAGKVPVPNLIKIDTEGFELEVLRGLGNTLGRPELRMLFIEVHFKLLRERGFPEAPREIEKMLETAGFSLRWPDASHLVAARRT